MRKEKNLAERMLVATRKGLLTFVRSGPKWKLARTAFPALHDPRDGTLYAALKHGHFGTKLHRSENEGRTCTELPAPA